MNSRLTPFQQEVLEAFFRERISFFLTGGAALAGFHLGHRDTGDLDLFTCEESVDSGEERLRQAAVAIGAEVEEIRTAPDFRRRIVRRGEDAVIVDLVKDVSGRSRRQKLSFGGVSVDPPEDILANKLCTLLSRAEIRDLVDVRALDRAGWSVEAALPDAAERDGGLTPGQLAWVLSEVRIGNDARVPGGVTPDELRDFQEELLRRLSAAAMPKP